MDHRSRSADAGSTRYLILLAMLGCSGARRPPAAWAEQSHDAGASTRPDASARTLAGSTSEEPPTPDACASARTKARGPQAPDGFEQSVESARTQAGELRAAGFGERSERAAELLRRLAVALASAPNAAAADATRICEITQQADALVSSKGEPFQGSAQIKRALSLAVELLDEHAERNHAGRLHPWLDAARGAVQSIDEDGMVSFQGPEIQDAFRTTVDALTVVAQWRRD